MAKEQRKEQQHAEYSLENFSLIIPSGETVTGIHMEATGPKKHNIVYSIGWGMGISMHEPVMADIAQKGNDIWSVEPPRVGTMLPTTEHQVAEVEVNKAVAVVSLLQDLHQKGIEEVDIVAHSEGAIYATIACLLADKSQEAAKVKSLILVEPAGFMHRENVIALGSRFVLQAAVNALKNPLLYLRNRKKVASAIDPRLMLQEVVAISQAKVPELLQKLYDRDKTNIGIIAGNFDGVFPARRIRRTLNKVHFPYEYKAIDIRHNGVSTQGHLIAVEVEEMLQKFDQEST